MPEIMDIEKIILPYFIIETKHSSNRKWINTMVLQCFKNLIELRQVEDYLTTVLMIGDELQCKYVTKDEIILIKTKVYNIKFASRSVVLQAYEVETTMNIRKAERYDVYLSASLSRMTGIGEQYCVVVNISKSGMSIISKSELILDERIMISIYFEGFHYLSALCSVRWCDKNIDYSIYGLSIENMDEIAQYQYERFLHTLKRRESAIRAKGRKLYGC